MKCLSELINRPDVLTKEDVIERIDTYTAILNTQLSGYKGDK